MRQYDSGIQAGAYIQFFATHAKSESESWYAAARGSHLVETNSCSLFLELALPAPPRAPSPMLAEVAAFEPIEGALEWREAPSSADYRRFYPRRAADRGVEGDATIMCVVLEAEGRLLCAPESENPEGWGFGDAAVRIARAHHRIAYFIDGQPTAGRRVSFLVEFREPERARFPLRY
jgi:hypothetical protein